MLMLADTVTLLIDAQELERQNMLDMLYDWSDARTPNVLLLCKNERFDRKGLLREIKRLILLAFAAGEFDDAKVLGNAARFYC